MRSGALVLLSGGIDSAVCLFMAALDVGGERVTALTFDWGQRCRAEERAASLALANAAGVGRHRILEVRFPYDGILTMEGRDVPLDRTPGEIGEGGTAPTYFPGRNLVLLAYAFGIAFDEGAASVYFGPNALDAAGYPDCRPEFVRAMELASSLALDEPGIRLEAPLLGMSKAQVVQAGEGLGVPWEITFSCYAPVAGLPCGRCDSCILRADAFRQAGIENS